MHRPSQVSEDLLHYFAAVAPLVHEDDSLLAASAWNDHGFTGLVDDDSQVLRTDHFPGLGWLCTRELYIGELEDKWPDFVWDVWLRLEEQTRGRQILIPEVPRTHHLGSDGSSMHLVSFSKWFPSMSAFQPTDATAVSSPIRDGFRGIVAEDIREGLRLAAYRERLRAELLSGMPVDDFWAVHRGVETVYTMVFRSDAWSALARYLGLWPRIPLPNLPIRSSFEGVVHVKWPQNGGELGESYKSLYLVDESSPHAHELLLPGLPVGKVNEESLNKPLPPSCRPTDPATLRVRVSTMGESCAEACQRRGMRCGPGGGKSEADWFASIDSCPDLVEFFGAQCHGGCEQVNDVERTPAFGMLPAFWHPGSCLLGHATSPAMEACQQRHPAATRLCPCLVL